MATKPTPDPETLIQEAATKAHATHGAAAGQRGVDVPGVLASVEQYAALFRQFYQSLVAAGLVKAKP
jgi:hypothetical protein